MFCTDGVGFWSDSTGEHLLFPLFILQGLIFQEVLLLHSVESLINELINEPDNGLHR